MSEINEKPSTVGAVRVSAGVPEAVAAAIELADGLAGIPAGAEVCLKPNLGFDFFYPGSITSPWVVEGVLRALRGRAGRIHIVESDQVLVDIEKSFRRAGMERLLHEYDVDFINLSRGRFVDVPVPSPRRLASLRLPEILTRSTLVTVPVLKTHDKTVISGAIKNQWGCLDVLRHNYHLMIDDVLADIHQVLRPALAVCDATIGLEGDGPKTGRPRRVDLVLASRDIVALDSACARLMGFDPRGIGHLRAVEAVGAGRVDGYRLAGEDLSDLNLHFRPAGHNTVSVVELALRSSALRRLVFETPVLKLMCLGAEGWYFVWYHLGPGARIRNRILRETPYGAQWR